MAFESKSLADGQVPAVFSTLYTAPVGKKTYLSQFNLHNESAVDTVTIDLRFVRSGSTARKWRSIELGPGESYDVLEDGRTINMSQGDSIAGVASSGSDVDYFITGVEES